MFHFWYDPKAPPKGTKTICLVKLLGEMVEMEATMLMSKYYDFDKVDPSICYLGEGVLCGTQQVRDMRRGDGR